MSDLYSRLRSVVKELHEIAAEYDGMKTMPSEEAMIWPLSIIKDEWGDVGLWCGKDYPECLLDGHNSEMDLPLGNFNIAQLLSAVVDHIERNRERKDDL